MSESQLTEADVEEAALGWLEELGWQVFHGPDIGPDSPQPERERYSEVVLARRLRNALARLNPGLPGGALEDASRRLTRPEGASIETRNHAFHRMLTDGITIEHRTANGKVRGAQVRAVDFDNPASNDWLAVNQLTVTEGQHRRRPDIVLFVNGLPLGVIELKNPADEEATVRSAWQQLQTYKAELTDLFALNELLIVSDGAEARCGTLTGEWAWFQPWRKMDEEVSSEPVPSELQTLLAGVCTPERMLSLVRDFVVFERTDSGPGLAKKMAGYHQFHAAHKAIDETLRAAGEHGDRRVGVVWHTQGAGKSLTMAFYAGAVVRQAAMRNPTIVVLTDRNDLDDQLFGTFSRCSDLLRQPPVQAESRADLSRLLSVESGGVVFTTIQKFFPEQKGDTHPTLSDRRNIVVIADEAHRSQYDFIDGYARHMRDALPNASFVGFTGTPIELQDANTRAVFGNHISIYDIKRSVDDGATVPIYYESRLAQLNLDEDERPMIDPDFEEATESEEVEHRERLKTKWAQLEAVVGSEKRLRLIAADIVDHFESRLSGMEGKAMVVCMSRRICVELYAELALLRPAWSDPNDDKGQIKVVMTGSAADGPEWQQHIRNKARREALARRFRDPDDPLRVVLVRDMWLTGFDAPSLHTMYVDKPMRGHGLMQAIARVNRVFRDKPGGLVVDYLGLAHDLRSALQTYTDSGGQGEGVLDQDEALRATIEKHEVCCGLFHGFDWSAWADGSPLDRLGLLPAAQEHILAQPDGKDRCTKAVRDLSQAFALSVPHPKALAIRDDLGFFQTVSAQLAKRAPGEARPEEDVEHAIRQIVSRAVASEGVLDIFAAAGLDRPDISVLSEDFLAEVRDMPQRNLAVELLQKLLRSEIAVRRLKNVVQGRSFAEMLEQTLRRYRNRAIEAAQVIEELIALAEDMREAKVRGTLLDLTEDELAFYDALETNDSAVKILGDETLRAIARELVEKVRNNVTIDWTLRENVRANLRVLVKRTLRRHGYPPDKQEQATETVLEQAEVLSEGWAPSAEEQ